ncbi:hypothetical protein BDR04DRAFT_115511 [Suillus decipiens]|nr:hypothetical protein BDR04DRAFT_115511 [Suillus decipiens]
MACGHVSMEDGGSIGEEDEGAAEADVTFLAWGWWVMNFALAAVSINSSTVLK